MRNKGVRIFILVAIFAVFFYMSYKEEEAAQPASEETVSGGASGSASSSDAAAPARTGNESIQLLTWNVLNFGKSKTDEEIAFMADIVRDFDVVALQEVNTGPDGAQTVARLDAELDRRGAQWDYVVSDPTDGPGSERYAYLWKPSRAKLAGRPWLEAALADKIDREPYMARFQNKQGSVQMLIASLHAVPRAKRPADEVAFLDELHRRYEGDNLLILGDFNLAESHYAFDELKQAGYVPAIVDQKTSLRMRRKDGQHLANEYDNIFYESAPLRSATSGVVDFTSEFRTLRQAREISDHIPVFMEVRWN